jgi:hypothetical protein
MLAQDSGSGSSIAGLVYVLVSLGLLVVWVVALVKFFQLASDVRSILRILLADSEARDDGA